MKLIGTKLCNCAFVGYTHALYCYTGIRHTNYPGKTCPTVFIIYSLTPVTLCCPHSFYVFQTPLSSTHFCLCLKNLCQLCVSALLYSSLRRSARLLLSFTVSSSRSWSAQRPITTTFNHLRANNHCK